MKKKAPAGKNISGRSKKSEELLKQSEDSFRDLFNAISDAIYILDKDGIFLDVNKSAEILYGYKLEEFIGRTPEFLSAPRKNNMKEIAAFIQKTFTTGEPTTFEFWGLKKNGVVFPTEVLLNKGTHFGQEVIIAIGRDITDRIVIQEALRKSEEQYRNLYQNSPIGIYRSTPQGKILLANASLLRMLRYPSFEELQEIDLKKTSYFKKNYRKSFIEKIEKDGEVIGFETAWLRKDDTTVFVRENSRAVKDENGNILFYEGTVEDITEKIIAEEELRKERELFMSGPVFIINKKATSGNPATYVSQNIKTTLGYDPEEILFNPAISSSVMHPDDRERVSNEVKAYIEAGIFNFEQEYRLKNKNGKYCWYSDFTHVVRNSDGEVTDYHAYLFDITSRKEAEEALLRSENELRNLNTMKDKFFSVIAHDLRSPFQGLLGMSNILLEDDELTDVERKTFMQKLHDGLRTQFNFIDNLLTWNRSQRGAIEFHPESNDISSIIQETLSLLNDSIIKKDLKISNNLNENIFAVFDRNILATVIRNLISNAIKFTNKGGEISISVFEKDGSIIFSVKDTGIGIDKINQEKLFRIDTHFSTKGTEEESGSGLGLIICFDFVEKHNGKIWVESELGKGSSFSFSIPKD
ncbi:MAG: PAS domain S-box protein [Ignavibacteriales bacterium]|nr:PAS domain S-box protein [Ignavibacteriales bacterium]